MFTKSVAADRGMIGQPRMFGARGRWTSRGAAGGGAQASAVSLTVSALAAAGRKGVIPGSAAGRFWWRDRARTQPWDPAVDLEKTVEFVDDLSGNPVGWRLGPDLLGGAGSFNSATGWSIGAGWSISGGAAIKVAGSATNLNFTVSGLVDGRSYVITATGVSISAATLDVRLGNTSTASGAIVSGTWSATVTKAAGSDATFSVRAGSSAAGVIGNITIQEVIRDESWLGANLAGSIWTLETGWAFSGGTLTATGAAAFTAAFQTSLPFVAGRVYSVTFTTTVTSGSVRAQLMGGTAVLGTTQNASGTYTQAFAANAGNTILRFEAQSSGFTGSISAITVREIPGHPIVSAVSGSGLVPSRRVNVLQQTNTVSTARTATTVAGSYRIYIGSGSVTLSGTTTGTFSAGTATFTATAGTLTVTPSGTATNVDVRLAIWDSFNLPAYQRVGDGTAGVFDYDDAGFPLHLKNVTGTQAMMTLGTVDMSAGDAGVLLANVVKLSDAAGAIVCELGTTSTTAGGMYLSAPNSAAASNYGASSVGSLQSTATASGYSAPHVAALITTNDVSADSVTLTVNGVAATPGTSDQGAGNKANAQFFIAARNAAASPAARFTGYFIGNFPALVAGDAGIDTLALSRELAAQGGYTY